ncbi:MAG: class I SAM-dependent methyltransferase, partial [Gemmatales bacterium]|nr:class I SAM-dependent methyltransferase [Gemmatales bacterium]MDW8385566.1 class I SAM-dependent methyltransferase [Gemmatales bacterium]
ANGDPRAQAALENVAHQLTRFLNGCAAPDRLFQWESLSAPEEPNEPFSLQWFLAIEHIRHSRSARWIPRLMEFTRHAGETLLGLGSGLGTDWLQYARYGAQVIACSRFAEEVALIRRNFALRGLRGRFLQAEPWAIPLPDASVDVVCLSGVLHEVERPAEVVAELWRLLRPGGKVLAIVPAKYGIDWWLGWLSRRRMRNHTPSSVPLVDGPFNSCPRPNFFSKRRLRKLFDGFEHCRVHKRHLSRREIPFLLRGVPRSWLERLLGRLLILKAFKPVHVSIAASLRQAA